MSSDICKRTLCVKNLSQPSEKLINNLFSSFGKISHKLITSTENNRKDIIVKFESKELASRARDAVHGKLVDGNNLFVDYALVEPPSRTSSSKSNQNPKVSVLDRIIKLGDPNYPKADEKSAINDKQNNQKDNLTVEGNHHAVSGSGKVFQHRTDRLDKSEYPSQLTVVKKSDIVDKGHDNRGHHDVGSNYENKRNYTTQTQEKISQRIYTDGAKRLEVIKPRRDENKLQNSLIQKESYNMGKSRQESQSTRNINILRSDNQRHDNLGKEGLNEPTFKANQYPSLKQKPSERSRSRSRDKSRHSHSSHNNPSYPYSNQTQRRSRSRSHSRNRLEIQKNLNNGFNSNHKNYQNHHLDSSYSHSRDPYYEKRSPPRYRDSDRRSRSRSRSGPRRGYSPYRDLRDRRDEPGYDYHRKRSPSRSRSRETSKSRSYQRIHHRSSRSRSPGRGPPSLNIERNRNYGPRKVIGGGLVIEKRDSDRKYPHDDDRNLRDKYRDDYNVYAKDMYSSNRRSSRSRERNYQNDWKQSSDYKYSKSPDSALSRKGLEKKSEMVIEKVSHQSRGGVSNYSHESRDRTLNKEIKSENTVQNPQYGNMMTYNTQKTYQTSLSNAPEQNLAPQNQIYDQYLPSYLSSLNRQIPVDVPLINNSGPFVFSEPIQNQLGMQIFEGQEKEYLLSKGIDEENETQNVEISLTDNTNDTVKTEEKGSPEKRELGGLDQENELDNNNNDNNQNDSNPLVNELIKNKKMQGIINYIVATGDIQGLKEKLSALGKLK